MKSLITSRHVVSRMYPSRTTRRETDLQRRRLRRSIKPNFEFTRYTNRRYTKEGRISSSTRVCQSSLIVYLTFSGLMLDTFDLSLSNPESHSKLSIPTLLRSLLICWLSYCRSILQRGLDVRNLWNTLSMSLLCLFLRVISRILFSRRYLFVMPSLSSSAHSLLT